MTEFDFDELDRAVNNLMTDVDTSKRDEVFDDPAEKTVEIADTQTQSAPVATTPVIAQPLAAKRRGRFMDVVHPSSDMNSSFAPKRTGTPIQPAVSVPSTDEANASPTETSDSHVDIPQNESTLDTMNDLSNFHEPQESATTGVDELTSESDMASENDVPADSQEFTGSSEQAPDLPQDSPFLADAKVEKRPLGAPSDASEETDGLYAPLTVESQTDLSQPVDEAPAIESTPQELSPEIMNIESSSMTDSEPEEHAASTVPAEQILAVESTSPTDIVPQYTESATHNSEPSGAIYDTAAYHQPLEHVAKKHGGWGIVLWVLLLLIVGAVAGAAYFYFTTRY